MDALSIAAVVGLMAVALGKKAPAPDGSGNVDGASPINSLPPPDPGAGGATEVIDERGVPVLSTNDGAGQILTEGTGGSGQHPTKPGGSCACVKAPCACDGPTQGGKGEGPRTTLPPVTTGSSPDKAPSGSGGYDGSGINPSIPTKPSGSGGVVPPATNRPTTTSNKPTTGSTTGTKPNPTTGGKPTTTGTKPNPTTGKQGPPIFVPSPIYTSLSKSTPKDVSRTLEAYGPSVGAIW